MRILMTTDVVGGVWRYAVTLVRELVAEGHTCALAVLGDPDDERLRALPEGVEVHSLDVRLEWMPGGLDDTTRTTDWLVRLARDWRADLVHLNQFTYADGPYPAPVVVVAHSDVLSWYDEVKGSIPLEEWSGYKEAVDAGIDVTGNARVDQEDRPVPATLQGGADRLGRDSIAPRAESRRQIVERHDVAAVAVRDPLRPCVDRVGDDQAADAVGAQRVEHRGTHVAAADQQHDAGAQIAVQIPRQLGRGGGERNGAPADPGFRPHAFRRGIGRLKQAFQLAGGHAGPSRGGVPRLDLAQDVRLADDLAVERRRHAEQVAHGVGVAAHVESAAEIGRGEAGMLGQDRGDRVRGMLGIDMDGRHLDPITRRQQQRLFEAGAVSREDFGESGDLELHVRLPRADLMRLAGAEAQGLLNQLRPVASQ